MAACRWYWAGSAALAVGGFGVTMVNFEWYNPWILVGLSAMIVACTVANTGFVVMRSRSMEEEFEAGYKVGYRVGRRAPQLRDVTPIRTTPPGFHSFNKAVRNGRLQKAPLGAVPSHDSAPRRT